MDLRKELITRLRAGERLTDLCREFGISRKTGSKYRARFERMGLAGLEDVSRAPHVIPHRMAPELVELVVAERRKRPTWGGRKIKVVLEERLGHALPSHAAIERALKKAGLVSTRKRRPRYDAPSASLTSLRIAYSPNQIWCIDYKGQFRLGDGSYCYPLTVTDQHSRFVLACEAMAAISDEDARDACLEVFRAVGLPGVIRSDNGTPFASTGLAGLTKLSALFIRLGIELERITPGHPQENGRHERMHRTLKAETTRPARTNLLQQQERFDAWMQDFNEERPHEAIDMKRPAQVFTPSSKPMPASLPELAYPLHDDVLRVGRDGHINVAGVGSVRLTSALVGHDVGVREELDGRLLITFATIDLGHIDGRRLTPLEKNIEKRS